METSGKALNFDECSVAFENGTASFRPLRKSRLRMPLRGNIKPFSPGSLAGC
jgi:hypothetical protein